MPEERETEKDLTAPPSGNTHKATQPPGSGDRDEDAIKKGEENLDRAAGGTD